MNNRIITGILILSVIISGYGKDSSYIKNKIPDRQSDYLVGLSFIPEMDFIPEIDSWSYCDTAKNKYTKDIKKAKADWKEKHDWIKGHINIKLVKSLSRWAKKEMKKYNKVPALPKDIKLKPIRYSEVGNKIVFESTLDTLPTHSSIVTRWLKIIILYDRITESITKVTITIRGEILE
jgi:hypothetical protein